jgi:hypothetical protein
LGAQLYIVAKNDSISIQTTPGTVFAPSWGELRPAFRELFYAGWVLSAIAFAGILGFAATFLPFGFDRLNDTYPFVADGWGLWYWLAQADLSFTTYSLLLNCTFAALIFRLARPFHARSLPVLIAVTCGAFFVFWFLLGQARYGMGIVILAPAALAAGWFGFWVCAVIAILIHKGLAGAVAILFVWRFLHKRKGGLVIAIFGAVGMIVLLRSTFGMLLQLAGYANYSGWSQLPAANTPLKYYYLFAVLLLWAVRDRTAVRPLFILTVLFLPTAYFNVFAGRAFQVYSGVLFASLLRNCPPRYIQVLIALPYVVEISSLVFWSGLYF